MGPSANLDTLRHFRNSLHECFHRRADVLFELTDAILTAGVVASPAHLSLQPSHRRGWVSLYAALQLSFEHDCWAAPMDVSCLSPKANAGEVVAKQVKGFVRRLEERDGVPLFVFDAMLRITSKQPSASGGTWRTHS